MNVKITVARREGRDVTLAERAEAMDLNPADTARILALIDETFRFRTFCQLVVGTLSRSVRVRRMYTVFSGAYDRINA